MLEEKKIIGIVLCGGKSTRMRTEKGLVKWKGKTLIEYSVDCLKKISDQVIISSNKACYDYINLPVIPDEIENCGPIGGIYSCMNKFNADFYLVISCDVPNVPSDLFVDLLNNIGNSDLIYAVDEDGKKQPLVAVYKRSSFNTVKNELMSGNYKMMKLLSLIQHKEFQVNKELSYYRCNILSNANSPDDLKNI